MVLSELEGFKNAEIADILRHGMLRPAAVEIFQINVGKLCNMTCRHCHVDAGPDRVEEVMDRATIEACLSALDRTGAHTVDLTGGAPELNPSFRYLVDSAVLRGKHVIDRSNLTVLLALPQRDLPAWLAKRGVEIVASLPHWRRRGTDAQRGDGTFEKSLEALRRLNAVGYGWGDPCRRLTLAANPVGAYSMTRSTPVSWRPPTARK
jgi:radical SAM/Cys-rich protein